MRERAESTRIKAIVLHEEKKRDIVSLYETKVNGSAIDISQPNYSHNGLWPWRGALQYTWSLHWKLCFWQ